MSDPPKIRASERVAFQRCPQAWWWRYREGLVPKSAPADALWFGTGVHLALALWYCGPGKKRGPEPAETWLKYAKEMELAYVRTDDVDDETHAKYVDAAELGRVMLEGYRERYGRDEHMLVVSPERQFRLALPWPKNASNFFAPKELVGVMAELVGTYDLVWRHADTGQFWLEEHKTARSISKHHLALDNQGGTYWATAATELQREGLIPKGSIAGIEYNFLRKALPDDRPKDAEGYATNKPVKSDYIQALTSVGIVSVNGKNLDKLSLAQLEMEAKREGLLVLGSRSKIQPKPLFERVVVHRTRPERKAQLLRAQQDALHMELYRRGLMPPTKSVTKDCRWCPYYDMCELQERGGDWRSLRDAAFRVEDPYADHRKSTDE